MIKIPIKSSQYFSFADEISSIYNIINVNLNANMQDEPSSTRTIIEQKIRGRTKPYFQGLEYEPKTIHITAAFTTPFDNESIQRACRWLCSPTYYKPLFFSDEPHKIYYALVVEDFKLIHNCLSEGYLDITFRCNDYYAYSPYYYREYDFSNNTNGIMINFDNLGDVAIFPEMWIQKTGDGDLESDLSIINYNDAGREFKFLTNKTNQVGLVNNEKLYIDNENRYIETDLTDMYRYDSFNHNYLKLLPGRNSLLIKGRFKLKLRWQYKFI